MGSILSSYWLSSSNDNFISSSLISSQLIHRHTLSTCYDSIFDVSLSSKTTSILLSDDGRLRLFNIDLENGCQLIETTTLSTKLLTHEQIHDIQWCTNLDRFLILTSKRLTTFDNENNLINVDLELEKGSPPFWRMACWSFHLILNLGLGTYIRYYKFVSLTSLPLINSLTRSSLGYNNSDLLSSLALSPQLILAINVELNDSRHVIDLFSINDTSKFHRLKRINSNEPCSLDIITSLRNCTWLCKSHWPSDDCLCIIESNGQVNKVELQEQNGYILNLRLLADRSHLVIVRTPNKLPKEIDITELNRIEQAEERSAHRPRQKIIGKLPGNLLLEIYKIPLTLT
ncbi:unnamed protein product [Rotaria sp. Silwood2]|nr:unnamed protein product [Rotaria sp. Silwood2]CAF2697589.1 unnamed protein product [Rotaria sp. Silwood2]CAF3119554.1 unnamed protein product [Rotaria sp. Silwood2]CAF4336362.1 unnamed protein product [Rotaria sp. Silwood2]CAF4360851.1 unnamed protein product [Rotaria sp. Silwood2]